MSHKPASLRELLDRYLTEHLIDFDEKTRDKHGYVLTHYEAICGPGMEDLSNAGVAKMMAVLIGRGRSRTTVNGYRSKLIALWTWACKQGWLTVWPSVRKLSQPKRAPIAWSPEEVAKIWSGLETLDGFIGPVPRSLWWSAYHGVLFDSGERHEARMALRWEHFSDLDRGEGKFPFSIRKGQTADMPFHFGPATVADLKQLLALDAGPRVFPWPYNDLYFFEKYRTVLQHCGVAHDRYHLTHCGRKYVATQIRRAGGDATQSMGHASQTTTDESYIDARFILRTWPHELLPDLRPKDSDPPRAA